MNDKINTLNILSQKEFSSASGAGRCGGNYEKNSRESLHISNMFLNFASSETKNDDSTLIKVLLLALFLAVGKWSTRSARWWRHTATVPNRMTT